MLTTSTAVVIAVALWFATGWYLNERLKAVHSKLDKVLDAFHGLREYLYEIDPQFDEERQLLDGLFSDDPARLMDGMDHLDHRKNKAASGLRTLNSTFFDGGFRSPRYRSK